MWLRSGVAVAVVQAGSCSSDWIPGLGTSICCVYGPKKTTEKNAWTMGNWKNQSFLKHLRGGIGRMR